MFIYFTIQVQQRSLSRPGIYSMNIAKLARIRPKKNCYIGVTRPTLKLGLTLYFFLFKPKKNLILALKMLIWGFETWLVA